MRNLLLITCGGVHYGVWKDEVPSLVGALPLHRLPLSPPAIAGVALFEDRSAVIADLGACLGCLPMTLHRDGTFFIINTDDKFAGFCVEEGIEGYECPPERVLPLPPVVATPVVDTCAVYGTALIPIINIGHLHDRLKRGLLELPFPETGKPADASDLSGLRSIRVLSVDDAWFCVNAVDTLYATLGDGGIAPLPVRSRGLAGVALHDGAAVPVMLPEMFLGCGKAANRKGLLLIGPPGARYGVAVDQDHGIVEGEELAVLALPKLAATPWLPAAALAKGKICLFVDCNMFAVPEDTAGEGREAPAFIPSSQFPLQFRKTGTAIVEFSFLGTRHAVPREEMKDDLELLPFIPVPGTTEIVLGVAELRGELLPVLDLAALFGRRSPIGEKSRMMHIVNGDFQALVITSEVAGSRMLPVETHRRVPIALPHQVLYGCYLDEGMVRLILNVEALAVNFEKIEVRELAASLSPELMEAGSLKTQPTPAEHSAPVPADIRIGASAGAVEAEPEHAAVPTAAEIVPEPEETAVHEQAKQRFEAERFQSEEEARSRAVVQARMQAEVNAIAEKRARENAEQLKFEAEALARAEAETREQEEVRRKAAEESVSRAAEEARKRQEEESRQKALDLVRESAAAAARTAAGEAVERQAAEEAKRQAAGEARLRAEEESRKLEQQAAQQRAAAEEQNRETERLVAEQARVVAELEKREADEARQRENKEAEGRVAREAAAKAESRTMPDQRAVLQFSPEPAPGEVRPAARVRGKYRGIAAVIALFLALLIYFFGMPKRPEPQQLLPEKTLKQAETRENAPQPEKEPPLYLMVPPDKATSASYVYSVVKGDNLWNIAMRFTGNPLNYPSVARDNSIATPDLIFPGQRIRLMQQNAAGTGSQGNAERETMFR
jgi:chemotaxis signal transduction protein